ncbi:hypothetical protein GN244_ATG04119 [Phytophthora infestans]|uniref:Uncharacterized protein n=1 Tax=Phytophthora infestans TaxID=4787 RepID=A0A833T075_PHYIN|nr:hypothetical protein GN244_ATG04119 [Phytophthora infestans]
MYEIGKAESEITEDEWKSYFLEARRSEVQDPARLAQAMRALSMDTSLPDAESRVMKLVTDFNAILDSQDMDDFPLEEPKMTVTFLCAALKSQALKQTVITELKRTVHKSTKKSVKVFLYWLKSRVSAFLLFESAIQHTVSSTPNGGALSNPGKTNFKPHNTRRNDRFQRAPGGAVSKDAVPRRGPPPGTSSATKVPGQPRKSFKCRDATHGVFQCLLASATEAKEQYEKLRKQSKTVGAVALAPQIPAVLSKVQTTAHARRSSLLQCVVKGVVEATAKPDSGAEVSVVSPRLLQELSAKGQWMKCQDLTRSESIEGITKEPMIITQEVKSDLQFATANGNLTLINVTCWVVGAGLPPGMGDILLSESVMGRLGYNPQERLDKARSVSGIYDMDDGSEVSGVRRVLAYASTGQQPATTPEEQGLQEEEEQCCFPEVDFAQDREDERAIEWSTLEAKLEEAAKLGGTL